jgi:hypothetical protein
VDVPGVGLAATGLFALVFGLVRGQGEGWTSPLIVASLAAGIALLGALVAWERRAEAPMVPMALFRKRTFSATNGVSFFMYFGTFGSIFLLTQVLQNIMGYSPVQAGVRMLFWTGATMIVAPVAGVRPSATARAPSRTSSRDRARSPASSAIAVVPSGRTARSRHRMRPLQGTRTAGRARSRSRGNHRRARRREHAQVARPFRRGRAPADWLDEGLGARRPNL